MSTFVITLIRNGLSLIILSVLIGGIANAQVKNSETLTELDQAHADVRKNEANIPNYYETLLETPLYLYIAKTEDIGLDDTLQVDLRSSLFKNLPLINAFDTRGKAITFGQSRGFPPEEITEMNAVASFRLMPTEYYVYLNPETEYEKLFGPNEVRYVAGLEPGFSSYAIETKKLKRLTSVTPKEGNFTQAIRNLVDQTPSIISAYITQHPDDTLESEDGNYLVVLITQENTDTASFDNIAPFFEGKLSEVGIIDFVFTEKKDIRKFIKSGQHPFHTKSDHE